VGVAEAAFTAFAGGNFLQGTLVLGKAYYCNGPSDMDCPDGGGLEELAQIGDDQIKRGQGNRTASAGPVAGRVYTPYRGTFPGGAGSATWKMASNQGEGAQDGFQKKYGDILKAGNINIDQNVKDARSISTQEWLDRVRSGGDWDYKKSQLLIDARISSDRLDEFGNVHFGIVANAHGFNLEGSMYGAGAYQVLRQGGGNPSHLGAATTLLSRTNGGYTLPDSISRAITRAGFTWGDNVGDSVNIMNGWDYAQQNY
jgi:hypothetical protein